MEWIGLIALVVILLKTIANDGDWFELLERDAKWDFWWDNFEFNAFVAFLCILIVGGGAWLFVQGMKPEPLATPTPTRHNTRATTPTAPHHLSRTASRQNHKQHLHH